MVYTRLIPKLHIVLLGHLRQNCVDRCQGGELFASEGVFPGCVLTPQAEIQRQFVADPDEGWKELPLIVRGQRHGLERPFKLVERPTASSLLYRDFAHLSLPCHSR
jgi:hypothetical protein